MGDGGPSRPGGAGQPGGTPGAGWARFAVRALVVLTAGIMATGFLEWRAGLLVAGLTALTYVLLGTLAPRLPAPYGRGRMLRTLRQNGYHVVPAAGARHLAVGPGGVYLLETRTWQHAVSRGARAWWIGGAPAERVVERLAASAARLDRVLDLSEQAPGLSVVPVVMVAGRLPEPVMRSGSTIIARPRGALRYLLRRPDVLTEAEIDALAATAEARILTR